MNRITLLHAIARFAPLRRWRRWAAGHLAAYFRMLYLDYAFEMIGGVDRLAAEVEKSPAAFDHVAKLWAGRSVGLSFDEEKFLDEVEKHR